MTYKTYIKNCEICGKEFKRSAKPEAPPKYCGRDCLYQARMGQRYEKYIVDEKWFPVIRETYATSAGKRGAIAALAKRIGVPRTKITNIARSNGWIPVQWCRKYDYYWCDGEEKIVLRNAHGSPVTIQRRLAAHGYKRTCGSIEYKLNKLRARQNIDGQTANDLAMCLGVDVHSVLSAIRMGKLKAGERPGYDKKTYYIRPDAVREYIISYISEIDIRKVDKFWFVDILAEGKI